MQAITLVFPPLSRPLSRTYIGPSFGNKVSRTSTRTFASRGEVPDQDRYSYNSRLVDESMIVLRKRLHELKMVEKNYEPPEHWMEWEKRWYMSYDEFVCNLVGILQIRFMDMRPSVALGVVALVALSVPMSTILVFMHVVEMANGVLGGIHLG